MYIFETCGLDENLWGNFYVTLMTSKNQPLRLKNKGCNTDVNAHFLTIS